MKGKVIIASASVILLIAIVGGTVLFTLGARIDRGDYYALDEELFLGARRDDNTEYLAYLKSGELQTVWESSSISGHEWLALSEMGEYLVEGFISAEDREFYSHKGVNIRRTLGAIANYVTRIRPSFGASTITQQVIKNISGDNAPTATRKFNEIMRAVHLERLFTKDEILEVYLNIVPMSGNMYGVSVAAESYFGKEPSELTLAEAATVVGITNSPTKYDPRRHPEECRQKRNRVLYAMRDNGAISEEEYQSAASEPLLLAQRRADSAVSSWFVETASADVLRDLSKKYSVSTAAAKMLLRGAKVVLTVDPDVQSILEEFFSRSENLPSEVKDGLGYAMTVIDNRTGDLVATVGGAGKKQGNRLLNLAEMKVPPASTLKPLAIYAPMLEDGMINSATVVDDTPIRTYGNEGTVVGYPMNSPNVYEGLTTVEKAIRTSKNTVAVKLLERYGAEKAFNRLKDRYGFALVEARKVGAGIVTDMDIAPLALGQLTDGVTLRELTSAYSAFAREGIISAPRSYIGVFDSEGGILLDNSKNERRIYSSSTCRIMNQLLSGVVNDGTASSIRLKETVDVAGKTGTSSGNYDRLFVGYTPYYTAGIWCGYADRSNAVYGVKPSQVKIWDRVMTDLHEQTVFDDYRENYTAFSTAGLKYLPYCIDSGCLPSELCELDMRGDRIAYGYFTEDNAPSEECTTHALMPDGDPAMPRSGLNITRDLPEGIDVLDNGCIIKKEEYGIGFDNTVDGQNTDG